MRVVHLFRWVSLFEGISYLVLLGVAMPLKYLLGQPEWVRFVGSAHGVLFVAFVVALVAAAVVRRGRWGVARPLLFFGLSLVPLGFIYIEYLLRSEQTEDER